MALVAPLRCQHRGRESYIWTQHPLDASLVMHITGHEFHIHDWESLQAIASTSGWSAAEHAKAFMFSDTNKYKSRTPILVTRAIVVYQSTPPKSTWASASIRRRLYRFALITQPAEFYYCS